MKTRREFLTAVGAVVGSLVLPDMMPLIRAGPIDSAGRSETSNPGIVEIRMRSDGSGANVWFDPIGIHINPGKTVRWVVGENVHTTTAYHPKNGNHSLRIPESAVPWDSGYLVNPGDHFEVTLTAEGVYDYFCIPHEMAGMVGRIIVGRPIGPGAMPFDYYRGKPGTADWQPVPEAAQKAFPHIDRIMRERIVRR
jgi:plastocyanin